MIFESHAHYDDEAFDIDREAVLASLPSYGISHVINVGADMASSRASIELSKMYEYVFASVGVHPHSVGEISQNDIDILVQYADFSKVVAIGEIGLDYFRSRTPREVQKHWFREQLAVAKRLNMPVIIHSRDACADTLEILRESGVQRGVIHCFSGSVETAAEYVRMGYFIGIGGVVTYKNAKVLPDVVKAVDLEHILLETDCPYLAPTPHRGERNTSQFLQIIAEKIGQIKQISSEIVAKQTHENARCLFSIK